ncbi:MAG: sterol desaturase family protein [Pseudomonadota bacterium]
MTRWNHRPSQPLTVNPLFRWPPQPMAVLKWYIAAWLPFSISLAIVGLAWGAYMIAPTLAETAQPGLWIIEIWLRNLVVVCIIAHGLHLIFHQWQWQGTDKKYDPRPFPRQGRMFTFQSQLADNVFWTLASGVTVWTAWECILWGAMANGYAPTTTFTATPIWFVVVFFLIPIWESFYFYWIHRILHTRALYRFHALHHRNTDVGPWSGLSMHPIEHMMYFGTASVHFILPTHPVHLIAHLMFYGIYAITTHTGFEGLFSGQKKRVHLGNFHHQMYHRFFEVNYGTLEIPWDKFFGTFHDGSDQAEKAMKTRLKERASLRG